MNQEDIRRVEKIDRRLKIRRNATMVLFAALSVLLILYVVRVERKLSELSKAPAVVIYKDVTDAPDMSEAEVTTPGYEADCDDVTTEYNTVTESGQQAESEKTEASAVTVKQSVSYEKGKYFVTASGKKFHRNSCSYLTSTKREISYDEFVSGSYTPCSKCIN